VLGADVVVLERPRLVLSEDDNLASPFSKAFEQVPRLSFLLANRSYRPKVEPIVADPPGCAEHPEWANRTSNRMSTDCRNALCTPRQLGGSFSSRF